MTRRTTPQTSLDNLRKEAKRWLKQLRANDNEARTRYSRAYPKGPAEPGLRDIQHAIALEYGQPGWTALKTAVGGGTDEVTRYERTADDLVAVYATGDAAALARVNQLFEQTSTAEDIRSNVWRMRYKVRQAKGAPAAFDQVEARNLIAGVKGFNNWTALIEAVSKGLPSPEPIYATNETANSIAPRRLLSHDDWDVFIDTLEQQRIRVVEANGFMTDDVLKRIAKLDHVTSLRLGGSRQLSDDGLLHLANMPQLEELELSEYPGGKLTDRGLEVLRQLPNLRKFEMTWQAGISDAGVANLKYCDKLESVNLMGSPTGDGAIEALRGKPLLHRLDTGRLVTDAGLAMLHDFPLFKSWHGEVPPPGTKGEPPTHLLIDGPFTNKGLEGLKGLDGVCALDLFWHVTGITSDGFAVLPHMRNLLVLACDGKLSDNEAMRHIGMIPRLRHLRTQESAADDDGFIALSRSQTLEGFWGRRCEHLTGRGFKALSTMPSLRSLGVNCANVDDDAFASLPHFPSLRELTPMGVLDAGFRHIGKCTRLERLTCMYCRDTTDIATEHITSLRINYYYAGLTKITDRSLELLSRIETLETIELYETKGVTDAGLLHLIGMPRLREVGLAGIPNVTYAGTQVFPPHIRVQYNI